MQTTTAEDRVAAKAPAEWRRRAQEAWRQAKPRDAMAAAWTAFDLAAHDRRTHHLLAALLRTYPAELTPERRADYLRLLTDPANEPHAFDVAGWSLLLRGYRLSDDADDGEYAQLAEAFEHDELALALLREAPVSLADAEHLVTRLRRWLLLSAQGQRHPALLKALQAQALLNGGAWPFDDRERAKLDAQDGAAMRSAYLPARSGNRNTAPSMADPVTRAVAAQYEGWPYPAWTRITRPTPTTVPDQVRMMDPALAALLPVDASILIAGCGTGREAAYAALRCPDATVTGIDVSAASLDYGRRQCAALGITNVRFQQLDLHEVAQLGARFHAIHCSGVLHHLPDPERGWRILTEVLAPAGVMRIMVYNKVSRMRMWAARKLLGDLVGKPIDDDLLRQVRGTLIARRANPMAMRLMRSRDFTTLAGAHDLLLHRHEDPFDLLRIERAIAALGLCLLRLDLPTPVMEAQYDAKFPQDPGHRDFESLIAFAHEDMGATWGHFQFWCARAPAPAAG